MRVGVAWPQSAFARSALGSADEARAVESVALPPPHSFWVVPQATLYAPHSQVVTVPRAAFEAVRPAAGDFCGHAASMLVARRLRLCIPLEFR